MDVCIEFYSQYAITNIRKYHRLVPPEDQQDAYQSIFTIESVYFYLHYTVFSVSNRQSTNCTESHHTATNLFRINQPILGHYSFGMYNLQLRIDSKCILSRYDSFCDWNQRRTLILIWRCGLGVCSCKAGYKQSLGINGPICTVCGAGQVCRLYCLNLQLN